MLKLLKRLKWYDWLLILLIISLIITQVNFEMKLIDYMGEIVKLIQNHADPLIDYTLSKKDLWNVSLKMLGCAGLIMGCIAFVSFLAAFVSSKFAKTLRREVFKKVNSFSEEEMNNFSTPSLITRSTNDINQVQQTLQVSLRMAITAPTMAAFAIKNIFNSSLELTGATGIAILIMFLIILVMFFAVVPVFGKIQKLTDKINSVARENLTGIRVVRAYNAEEYQQEKFENVNNDLTKKHLYTSKIMSFMMPGMTLVMNGLTLTIYWLGASLMNSSKLNYSQMVTFNQYAMHVLMSFMFISMIFIMIPRGIVSGKRINQILEAKSKIKDGNGAIESEQKGVVEFKNVSFKYPDAEEYVIENVSFKANKGDTVAFIGSTGSGKSTLINLIPRFFDATEGEVLVDNINVKDYKLKELNDKLGYVPQRGLLFSGTIESNLRYGKEDATPKEIERALEISQAEEFVSKLEEGIKSPIARGGTNVSGGQRQRLCIARAIIKNPEIFIFDDSFSALDYKTDKLLRKELAEKIKDSTKLIVAQRIGTIMDADQILVLDSGKVVGQGKHQDLLKNCEVYREIAYSQLSKEELENGK